MINGHGDDGYQYHQAIKYNFSSNVYYKGCHPNLLSALEKKIGVIESYPSPIANELNIAAGTFFNINPNQFLFGNGATELFYLIAQCYKGKKATIIAPTFSEYQDACSMFDIEIEYLLWSQIEKSTYKTDLVFICNPNNPTGQIISVEGIEKLLENNPNATFVVDEAYIDFCEETTSCIELLQDYKNLIIVKSLTKTFAIPGLRLGYLVADSTIINRLLGFKQPWTTNALAIVAGKYIFSHYEALLFNVTDLLQQVKIFAQKVDELVGFDIKKTCTHYFIVKLQNGTAKDLKKYLIEEHKILIRDATNFNKLEGECIRISIQKDEANKALIQALTLWNSF